MNHLYIPMDPRAIPSFLHLAFLSIVALFPVINPPGTALMVDPFLNRLGHDQRKAASMRIALYAFLLCVVTLLTGSWLFKVFGVSLAVVQLAGGILICRTGWQMLSSEQGDKKVEGPFDPERNERRVESILFYPLTFPMTTGAGTISILLTLSARGHNRDLLVYGVGMGAILLSVSILCAMVYFFYSYAPTLLRRLGSQGQKILNSLAAFLVFCVGLQIGFEGLTQVMK